VFTWQIRHFATKVCLKFDTVQTPSERAAIIRAEATKAKKNAQASTQGMKWITKHLNINTPKFHSIVHYPDNIAKYRTTDSYSTQIVCQLYWIELLPQPSPTDLWSTYAHICSTVQYCLSTHVHMCSADQSSQAKAM
jgi:hypothetical protein